MEAMLPYFTTEFGNPGSLHGPGRAALKAVTKARTQVARFFNCDPEQVIFTSGGSEGNNLVIQGLETELRRRGKTSVTVSAIEHDSVLKAAQKLCIKDDFDLQLCNPDENGVIWTSSVIRCVNDRTGLVSVMAANNETGVINSTPGIGLFCHEHGILFHSDSVQFAGISKMDMSSVYFKDVDFATISGHKLHAPKGIGALFAREPGILYPLICGGAEQEFGLRGGTENVPYIVALGAACEIADNEIETHFEIISELCDRFLRVLSVKSDKLGVEYCINGEHLLSTPKTVNIRFPGIDAQTLLLMLDISGICVSAGSACTSHENRPSHVLTAMGLSDEDARSSIRVSFSFMNTPEEAEEAAEIIANSVSILKG